MSYGLSSVRSKLYKHVHHLTNHMPKTKGVLDKGSSGARVTEEILIVRDHDMGTATVGSAAILTG